MTDIPTVTAEDRKRGWAELEIVLVDGSREHVRVHAVTIEQGLRLLGAPLDDTLAVVLRQPKEFVARIRADSALAISKILASFMHGEKEAGALMQEAAVRVIQDNLPKG